jgi:uncharacterized membrane protein
MYPKARLDALHDGVFSVAMTLLVLDVHLPDDFLALCRAHAADRLDQHAHGRPDA